MKMKVMRSMWKDRSQTEMMTMTKISTKMTPRIDHLNIICSAAEASDPFFPPISAPLKSERSIDRY